MALNSENLRGTLLTVASIARLTFTEFLEL